MRKDNKPKWEIQKALAAGREAQKLVQDHKQDLEPRLKAGAIEGLAADLEQLDSLRTGRPARVIAVSGLTGTQKEIAKRGAKWVNAIRDAVKRHGAGPGLRKSVGVGKPVQTEQAPSVATAVQAILAAAKEHPDEIRACGILDVDIQKGQSLLGAIGGAVSTQDGGMGEKKDLTDLKNRVQMRLEAAVESISSVGHLHYFDTDALLAQRFLDLIPSSGGNGGTEPPPPEPPKA
jgi:hypothetical protein